MTYVSRLTVTTQTHGALHALRAEYKDGALTAPPRPCAGLPGTTIAVEDLFYNIPTRRKALKSASEEYGKVLEVRGFLSVVQFCCSEGAVSVGTHQHTQAGLRRCVFFLLRWISCRVPKRSGCAFLRAQVVQRYALLKKDVAFSCRKQARGPLSPIDFSPAAPGHNPFPEIQHSTTSQQPATLPHRNTKQGEARSDLHTPVAATRRDRLRAVYGPQLARQVLDVSCKVEAASEGSLDEPQFSIEGLASGPEYSDKKTTLVLFINGRLVECSPLKRAIESCYAAALPKGEKPFCFLDVRLPLAHVDVNVHPTKSEVQVLFLEEMIAAVQRTLEATLVRTTRNLRCYLSSKLVCSLFPGAAYVF